MHDAMYSSVRRVAFKGQVFSAPMDWSDLLDQLEKIEKDEERIELPVLGEALLSRVRLSITSGLVDLNKHMKQATVRRDVVVQLIRMHRDAGHPDYKHVFMERVEQRARELAPTNDPTIPSGLLDVLDEDDDEATRLLRTRIHQRRNTPHSDATARKSLSKRIMRQHRLIKGAQRHT